MLCTFSFAHAQALVGEKFAAFIESFVIIMAAILHVI